MDRTQPARAPRRIVSVRAATLALFALFLVSGPAIAACSGAHPASTDGEMAAMPTMDSGRTTADVVSAVWDARPAYVSSHSATEEAYAFALASPEIVRWMPCYCGCGAMDHRSNLDCYFKKGVVGDKAVYEEHASYCDICVDITLKAKQLSASGLSPTMIRQVVDETFGGSGAPGTDTALPPT